MIFVLKLMITSVLGEEKINGTKENYLSILLSLK